MIVITGAARSGSKYIAEVMKACGLRFGHERIFRQRPKVREALKETDLQGDSSWMAVPYLKIYPAIAAFHQVRHPLRSVNSIVARGFLDEGALRWPRGLESYTEFARTYCPEAFHFLPPQDRALAYWTRWNVFAREVCRMTWRVEDVSPELLAYLFKEMGCRVSPEAIGAAIDDIPHNVNHKQDIEREYTWDDFSPALAAIAMEWARRYGYEV